MGPKSKVFEWMNFWCVVVFHLSALEIVSSSDLLRQTTVFSLEATNLQGLSIVFCHYPNIDTIILTTAILLPCRCNQPADCWGVEDSASLQFLKVANCPGCLAFQGTGSSPILPDLMDNIFEVPMTNPIELINNSMCMVSAMRSPSLWRLREDLVDSAPIEHYCVGPKNQNDRQHC